MSQGDGSNEMARKLPIEWTYYPARGRQCIVIAVVSYTRWTK